MSSITTHSCFNHPSREAVGRCLACSRVFCRECLTDHDDKLICASCLHKLAASGESTRRKSHVAWAAVLLPMKILASICVGWLCFYTLGRMLLSIPSEFHAGVLWDRASEMLDSE